MDGGDLICFRILRSIWKASPFSRPVPIRQSAMQAAHSIQRFREKIWNRFFNSISEIKKLTKEHGIRNTNSDVVICAVLSKSRLESRKESPKPPTRASIQRKHGCSHPKQLRRRYTPAGVSGKTHSKDQKYHCDHAVQPDQQTAPHIDLIQRRKIFIHGPGQGYVIQQIQKRGKYRVPGFRQSETD